MKLSIFIPLMFALQLIYWLVGRRASKNITGTKDYFLADKNVRLFPLMMTFLATQVGGGVILGAADEAYRYGWPVLLYPLGSALGLILLGSGFGKRLASFPVSTIAQIFEVAYKSPMLKKIAALLSGISLFMILVAQIIGSSKFLISLGFNNNALFVLFWAIVIFYTTQGGLRAVISTDMVQAAIFSAVFLICFIVVISSSTSIQLPQMAQLENMASLSPKLCGWLLMPMLFMIIEQDMGQRCFAGATAKIVSKACLLAGSIMMIVCIVPIFFGSLAKETNLAIPQGGSVLMTVIEQTTPSWLSSLAACAILAAIISTATSLINAISSNLSIDFIPNIKLKTVKVITSLISIGAIFFAFYLDNIVDVLIQSYELSVSCLFIPIFIALFKREGNFLSALLSVCLGAFGFILFKIYPIPFPKELASILLSLFGYSLGELLCRYKTRLAYKNL